MSGYTTGARASEPMTETMDAAMHGWTSGGLGSASAMGEWRWAGAAKQPAVSVHAAPTGGHAVLRVPREVLRLMTEAAWAEGRSEEEIWIEAAREWLRRRTREDDPPPTAPASAYPGAPRATAAWAAIDALVAELRLTAPAATGGSAA